MAEDFTGAIDRGLEGVVVCTTGISTIAGTTLVYRGYTIEDLAANASFEEVVHLLWYGRLPARDELAEFERELRAELALPAQSFPWFHGLPTRVHPMDFLHAVVAGLSLHDPDANVVEEQAKERKRGNWLRAAGDVLGGLFGSRRSAAGRIGRAAERLTRNSDGERVEEAQGRIGRIDEQISALDAELAAEQTELEAKWAAAAGAITTVPVTLERTDVKVTQLVLAWVPVP